MTWLPSPAAEAAERRQALGARVAAHLDDLPGVARASVVVAEPAAPLLARLDEPAPAARASVSALVVLDRGAPIPAGDAELRAFIAAAVPGSRADDVELLVTSEPAPPLVSLGPFQVAPASFAPLVTTLGVALLLVFALGLLLVRQTKFSVRR